MSGVVRSVCEMMLLWSSEFIEAANDVREKIEDSESCSCDVAVVMLEELKKIAEDVAWDFGHKDLSVGTGAGRVLSGCSDVLF